MKIEELKAMKKELGLTNQMVSEFSGVPLGTVQKIFGGATSRPRYDTLMSIEKVLFDEYYVQKREYEAQQETARRSKTGNKVSESNLALKYGLKSDNSQDDVNRRKRYAPRKEQGEYTIEDFYAMPDDRRIELIDGVIYDMTAPTTVHQFLIQMVFYKMQQFQMEHEEACMPMMSPVDVQLDCDERTVVEPDLIVVCNKEKNRVRNIYGAPDFVMEVLSPSTKQRDLIIKLNKYMDAGVREYWIVDPEAETITVYDFENDNYPIYYSFEDQIPVVISGGELIIDFSDISKKFHAYFGDWKATMDKYK